MEFTNPQVAALILIILLCGIVGGIGNALRESEDRKKAFFKNIVLGIIAATTVPLFLQIVSSKIIDNILSLNQKSEDYFVFAGFCIISSFSSISFLSTISGRVLNTMKEEIKNLKTENETIKTNNERIDSNLTAIAVNRGQTSLNSEEIKKITTDENIEILNSIKNDSKNFRPVEVIQNEVNQDNRQIQKKIEMLVEKELLKEMVFNDGTKAVALSEGAEQILNESNASK